MYTYASMSPMNCLACMQGERETAEKAAGEAKEEAERLQKKLGEAVAELEAAMMRNVAEQQRAQVMHPVPQYPYSDNCPEKLLTHSMVTNMRPPCLLLES